MNMSDNINQLVSLGYDPIIAKRYLELCNNNVEETIEFLINSGSVIDNSTLPDTSKLSDILYHAHIEYEKIDLTEDITNKLLKYKNDIHFVRDVLKESDGDFHHAKLLLTIPKND